MAIAPASGDTTAPQEIELPANFALKFIDTTVSKSVTIEPDQPTIILIDLKKNVITQVK